MARLGQILVEPKEAGERARDLRHLQRVREPRAVVVALVRDEDLGLVHEPAKGSGVDDAVAVAAKLIARGALLLRHKPPTRTRRIGGKGSPLSFRPDRHAQLPI